MPSSTSNDTDPTLMDREVALAFLAESGKSREHALHVAMARLRALVQEDGISAALSGRIKSAASIAYKARRLGCAPGQLLDILGVRIVVSWTSNCYRVAGLIRSKYDVLQAQDDDFIATPKANGYRAIHMTIVGLNDFPIELQLRTKWMNDVAERGTAARPEPS